MATMYLARDLKHNRPVDMKVLKPDLAAVIGAERFLQEIETTAGLQHPHILPLFESGEARRMPLLRHAVHRGRARSPGPGAAWPSRSKGGTEPAWAPDGSAIYYRSPRDSLMAAELAVPGDRVRVTRRTNLFSTRSSCRTATTGPTTFTQTACASSSSGSPRPPTW